VPLNTAGRIAWATNPGERQHSPFSFHLVFKGNSLFAASGAFSSSLMEASFQLLVNLLDYKLSAQDTVEQPRFGTFPNDPTSAMSISISAELAANAPFWLDPRVSPEVVKTLESHGLQ
jgi:gamma-glutamyltranspeptidase